MADMTPQGTQDYAVESGYESGDANVKAVVSGLSIILASTLVVMAAMFGMFNYLNRQDIEAAARVPVALTARVIPPEPRLLPSPYTDEDAEAQQVAKAQGVKYSSPDGFPWDKRNLEIIDQYDEANSYQKYIDADKQPAIRIPISKAIELESGATGEGTPAIMPWQREAPAYLAGEKGGSEGSKKGATMNLTVGQKNEEPAVFDHRASWETQDEKFTNESAGGTKLGDQSETPTKDQLSR